VVRPRSLDEQGHQRAQGHPRGRADLPGPGDRPSSCCAAKARPPSARAFWDAELSVDIGRIHLANHAVYGERKLSGRSTAKAPTVGRDQVGAADPRPRPAWRGAGQDSADRRPVGALSQPGDLRIPPGPVRARWYRDPYRLRVEHMTDSGRSLVACLETPDGPREGSADRVLNAPEGTPWAEHEICGWAPRRLTPDERTCDPPWVW
jgi:hypothetical protein